MDVLADVFAALRVAPVASAHVELAAPWGMRFARADRTGFHVVLAGTCWLRVAELGAPVQLSAGDTVFLTHGFTHALADTATRRAEPYEQVIARPRPPASAANTTRLLCGAFALGSQAPHTLLRLLPPLLHIRRDRAPAGMRLVIDLLSSEAGRDAPGATAAVLRCADLLLVYALRAWLEDQPTRVGGWLGALRDHEVGGALAAMHADVTRAWTIESLARRVGMSRASLARRFTALVGMPPLGYLTQWRMTLAAQRIRDSDDAFAAVAADVGYASEAAFHRAFRRIFDVAPGEYRRRVRALASAA